MTTDNNRVDSYCFRQRAVPAVTVATGTFYCASCSKNYTNRASFRVHLKCTKHLLNTKSKHSISENTAIVAHQTLRTQPHQIYCRPCKLSVSYRNIGRHLTSSFHSYNQQFHAKLANQMALRFIHEIVQWSPFQCAACKLFFNHERHFRAHWLTNPKQHRQLDRDPNRFWLCHNNYCTFYCRTAQQMQRHFDSELHRNFVSAVAGRVPLIVQNFKAFRCRVCRQQFRLAKSLQEHEKRTKHNQSVDCNVQQSQPINKSYQCDSCGQMFGRPETFNDHKKLGECTSYELLNGKVLVELQCEICKQLILRKSSVIRSHFNGHIGILQCTICIQLLRNDKDPKLFLVHLQTSHPTPVSFKCTVCASSFDKMKNCLNHCKLSNKCNRNVMNKASVRVWRQQQQQTITNNTKDSSTCLDQQPDPKINQCLQSLKRHTNSHNKYRCQLCESGFMKCNRLIEHYIETHLLDNRLFKCPVCDHRFSNLRNLRRHFFHGCGKCGGGQQPDRYLYRCPKCTSFATNCCRNFHNHLIDKHSDTFRDPDAILCFVRLFFIDVSH